MFEDGNYLENLLHNLSAKEDFSRSTTTGEFQRPYFENRSYGDLNEETTNENELQSPVRKKKKKAKKSKAKGVDPLTKSYYEENEDSWNLSLCTENDESESGLDLDDGFKKFLRESARFRAERGIVLWMLLFTIIQ